MAVGDYDILNSSLGEVSLIGYDDAIIGTPSYSVIQDMQSQAYSSGLSGGSGDVSSLGLYGSTGNNAYASISYSPSSLYTLGGTTYATTPSGGDATNDQIENAPDDTATTSLIKKETIIIGAAMLLLLVAAVWIVEKI